MLTNTRAYRVSALGAIRAGPEREVAAVGPLERVEADQTSRNRQALHWGLLARLAVQSTL